MSLAINLIQLDLSTLSTADTLQDGLVSKLELSASSNKLKLVVNRIVILLLKYD